jgi:hypothetical protein
MKGDQFGRPFFYLLIRVHLDQDQNLGTTHKFELI